MRIPARLKTAANRFFEKERLYKKGGPAVKPNDRIKSWDIFKGDEVEVIEGKGIGSRGPVIKVVRAQNSVIVGGVNMSRMHLPSGIPGRGLIIDKEALIHVSKVSLLDPAENIPTKTKWCQIVDTSNATRSTRISLRTGLEIPVPKYVPRKRFEGYNDTPPDLVTQRTFKPDLRILPVPLDCFV